MFAAFFMVFSVFLMSAVFRLLPPQGGESVAPYQAFGAHPLMQITETLHIMHYSKFLWDIINIQEAKSRIAKQLIHRHPNILIR